MVRHERDGIRTVAHVLLVVGAHLVAGGNLLRGVVEVAQQPGDRAGLAELGAAVFVLDGERAQRLEVSPPLLRIGPSRAE